MQIFSTIRLIVRRALQNEFRGVRIDPPASARVKHLFLVVRLTTYDFTVTGPCPPLSKIGGAAPAVPPPRSCKHPVGNLNSWSRVRWTGEIRANSVHRNISPLEPRIHGGGVTCMLLPPTHFQPSPVRPCCRSSVTCPAAGTGLPQTSCGPRAAQDHPSPPAALSGDPAV